MPRHIFRLILVIVVGVVAGYGAKRFFTVHSFYEYGHYRGDSVAEIASDKPKFKGVAYCAPCHLKQTAEWSNGVHNSTDIGKIVKCEVCHGAGGERDVLGPFKASATGADHPKNLKMVVPTDTRKLCTFCHERVTGRPLQQRQIVVADHAGTQQCVVCHNPHSPRLDLTPAETQRPRRAIPSSARPRLPLVWAATAQRASAKISPVRVSLDRTRHIWPKPSRHTVAGGRNNPMMSPAAKAINAEDAGNLAAYYLGTEMRSRAGVGCAGRIGRTGDRIEMHRLSRRRRTRQQRSLAKPCRAVEGLSGQRHQSLQGRRPQQRHDGWGREGLERRGCRKRGGLLRRRGM